MTIIELGTQQLRPLKNHAAHACDERCVSESFQERQYVYLRPYCLSEHLTLENGIGKILILCLSL